MWKGLFGNRNVERILLFLFVNERGYAGQIQSLLKVPLTPLQKALQRLEKEGIIIASSKGKIRLYELSQTYPLSLELEMLLKKAYTLLSAQEKKRYCFVHKPRGSFQDDVKRDKDCTLALLAFWDRLVKIQQLNFSAKSRHGCEHTVKVGKADVTVLKPVERVCIFQEKGHWLHQQLPDMVFSNSLRWTLDLHSSLITLEHLRYGETHPVFLFHLTATGNRLLSSVDAHLCGDDTYLGNIVWDEKAIDFYWRIIGPHKNHELHYRYL